MCSATITSRRTSSPTWGGTRWSAGSWRAGRSASLPSVPTVPRPPSAAALFLAESIASAFDLYLVGRLLPTRARVRLRHDAGSPDGGMCRRRRDARAGLLGVARGGRARAGARFRGSAGAAVRRGDRARSRAPASRRPRRPSRASPIAASRRCCTIISSRTGSSMRARMRPARSAATRSPAKWTGPSGKRRFRSTGWTVISSKPP